MGSCMSQLFQGGPVEVDTCPIVIVQGYLIDGRTDRGSGITVQPEMQVPDMGVIVQDEGAVDGFDGELVELFGSYGRADIQ